MLPEKVLYKNGILELINIFGKKYLQDNYPNTCVARGMVSPSSFMVFVGIKSSEDAPHMEPNDKGWCVYGKVLLDAITGKVKEKDYVLEKAP